MKPETAKPAPLVSRLAPVARQCSARHGWQALSYACALNACTLTADDFSPRPVSVEDSSSAPASDRSGATPPSTPGAGGTSDNPVDAPPSSDEASNPPQTFLPSDPIQPVVVVPDGPESPPLGDAGSDAAAPLVLPEPTELIGWASVAGLGVDTTTGGALGELVIVRSAAELIDFAARTGPLTIGIEGTLDVGRIAVASNKTLVGVGADATLRGGIAISGTAQAFVTNVIVSNLNVDATTSTLDGDGIQIQFAHHVWIDHSRVSDAADGLIDIVHGSDFITISHTQLFYTAAAPDPAHRFANLTGEEALNAAEDSTHLNVTWHHDFWGDGVTVASVGRYGRMHLFDNLFRSAGNSFVIGAGFASSWLVENNHFEDVVSPMAILTLSGASIVATGNVFVRTSGSEDTAGTAFVPPYAYTLEPTLGLDARIVAESGPR